MGRFIDLTGMTFGRWNVIRESGKDNSGTIFWYCECLCGNFRDVNGTSLRNGSSKSCGCIQSQDLTNMIFGRLTVIEYYGTNKQGNYMYLCKCECGNEKIINGSSLTSGSKTQSCGCLQKEKMSEIKRGNLLNERFGRWTVVSFNGINKHGETIWNCVCDCGNEKAIGGASLKAGSSKSCGCLLRDVSTQRGKNSFKDLKNLVFGKLTAIKQLNVGENGYYLWWCECDCGRSKIVSVGDLTSGSVASCGCLNESLLAIRLKDYCEINFGAIPEYKVLKNPKTNRPMPFDIFIPKNNLFIEIHGQQHYKFVEFFHKTIETFNYSKKKDRMKKKYARQNGTYIEIDLRKVKTVEKAIEIISNYL